MSVNINGVAIHPYCVVGNTNMQGSVFNRIVMHHSKLRNAQVDGAVMVNCNVSHCDFTGASLVGCDLSGSNFQNATLTNANLSGSLLNGTDFRNCDLSTTNLNFAYTPGMIIDKTTKLPNFQIPQEVDLIGYKVLAGSLIATLKIPANAKRTGSLGSRKCRAEFVEVMSVTNRINREVLGGGTSYFYQTQYRIGEIIKADRYDPDIRKQCTNGIHFFMNKNDAEEYLE